MKRPSRGTILWVVSILLVGIGVLYWLAALSDGLPPPTWKTLPVCGVTPNCVTSHPNAEGTPSFYIAPFSYAGNYTTAMARLRLVLEALPAMRIQRETPRTIQAKVRSPLFGFVDDVFFKAEPAPRGDGGMIHCYSASRVGHWDFGANRRRLERIREAFALQRAASHANATVTPQPAP